MKKFSILVTSFLLSAASMLAQGVTGELVFCEDFGGNDVNDAAVSSTPLSKISGDFTQLTTSDYPGMTEMYYIITKSGYCYGDTSRVGGRSQWYIQDDHTYPNDYSRGYFLEIDGKKGHQTIYETKVIGLDEGRKYSFSAWIANVLTTYQYDRLLGDGTKVSDPNLLFIVSGEGVDTILASYTTHAIPIDDQRTGKDDWKKSTDWLQYGCEFELPAGMNSVRLSICNNVGKSDDGNDFAIDDIELRQLPQDTTPIIPPDTTSHDTVPAIDPDTIVPQPISGDTVLLNNLIINKYNWILLCNNAAIAEYVGSPADSLEITYKWFMNDDVIAGANDGFYTEDHELNGTYRVEALVGNTLFISPSITHRSAKTAPVTKVMIYDVSGNLVYEGKPAEVPTLRAGIYIRKEIPSHSTLKLTIQ